MGKSLTKSMKMKKKKSTKQLVEPVKGDDVDIFSDPKVNQRR